MANTFTWVPNYATAAKAKVRLKKTQFGDGYMQRASDGINGVKRDWDLVFSKVTDADADAIEAFLEALVGSTILWVTPGTPIPALPAQPVPKKFICDNWKRDYTGPNVNNLSLPFEQVFE